MPQRLDFMPAKSIGFVGDPKIHYGLKAALQSAQAIASGGARR